jgi:ATP-dependent DNA helicase DinG
MCDDRRVITATPEKLFQIGMTAYDRAVAALPGFRQRLGQRVMAEEIARAFSEAELGEASDTPTRRVAVVQAGTGVGKSAAYILVGAAIAKARNTRLMISTSSVALQSQLVEKDLPMLSAAMEEPFTYTLAKGRGRYVCLQKLHVRAGTAAIAPELAGFEDDTASHGGDATGAQARLVEYRSMASALDSGWSGDRDTLTVAATPEAWAAVAADRHTCTAKACPDYRDCSFYAARRDIAASNVIVVNHSLLLASVGTKALPALSESLLVLDEGHHLPEKAIEQFAGDIDLTRLRWLEPALKVFGAASAHLKKPTLALEESVRTLKTALQDTARLLLDGFPPDLRARDGMRVLHQVEVEEVLREPLRTIDGAAETLIAACKDLGEAAREAIREAGGADPTLATIYAALGGLAGRLTDLQHTIGMLLTQGDEAATHAKWVSVDTQGTFLGIHLHACPILPGNLLVYNFWHRVRGAVVTSATMTSCGRFDFFLHEAGLARDPAVTTAIAASPFDYARQGRLVVHSTVASPKDMTAYEAEVSKLLIREIGDMQLGGLALFTSRRHLEQTLESMPGALRERVLVQGSRPRRALLDDHRARVDAGQASCIFGLQSFGEGLDLAGDLCRHLWIMRLPFGSPADAVSEARAEYVNSRGGDYFSQLVVPAAGVRLLQWTGRAIRDENDQALITCFDGRLQSTSFGRRILSGLPPYPVVLKPAQGATARP